MLNTIKGRISLHAIALVLIVGAFLVHRLTLEQMIAALAALGLLASPSTVTAGAAPKTGTITVIEEEVQPSNESKL